MWKVSKRTPISGIILKPFRQSICLSYARRGLGAGEPPATRAAARRDRRVEQDVAVRRTLARGPELSILQRRWLGRAAGAMGLAGGFDGSQDDRPRDDERLRANQLSTAVLLQRTVLAKLRDCWLPDDHRDQECQVS